MVESCVKAVSPPEKAAGSMAVSRFELRKSSIKAVTPLPPAPLHINISLRTVHYVPKRYWFVVAVYEQVSIARRS